MIASHSRFIITLARASQGNKGGVAVRFTLYDSSVCFISSHLAAHQNDVHSRNSDQLNIAKRLAFFPNNNPKVCERVCERRDANIKTRMHIAFQNKSINTNPDTCL